MGKNSPVKTVALWICRLVLGGIFAFAATEKILDPAAFARDIDHYRLLPFPLTIVFGLYLPWLELICGIGVLLHWRERAALLLTMAMCGVFCAALVSAWSRGLDINCGCFGHSTAVSALPWAIARSVVLGILAFLLLRQIQPAKARP